jgi:hypothetical protein
MRSQKRFLVFVVFSLFFSLLGSSLISQEKIDKKSTEMIQKYTTAPEFLSDLMAKMPESATVPSPRDVLGYIVGTPGKLTYYADIVKYYQALAKASPNVALFPIGKTNEGREMYLVAIASTDTIERLNEYKKYTALLSDPRKVKETEAIEIIAKAKPIYHITCNIHSGETGSAEMGMELAYRLAVSSDPCVKVVRDRVIVLITPCLEPDGHDRYTDWYHKYLKDITDEESRFPSCPYWGKYIFHDNNRDSLQLSQPLSKNLLRAYLEWHPQVLHDLHESIPFLYVSTGTGPFYINLDPILIDEWHLLASWECTELTKRGMPGVWTHAFYTGWYPGYAMWVGNLRNSIGRFYETFGNGGATTMKRKLVPEEPERERFSFTTREWYRPLPPYKEVLWSMRNNINYQETGMLAALHLVAVNDKVFLYNFWKKNKNTIEKGRNEPPYAYIISPAKYHRLEKAELINLLLAQGVELHRASDEIKIKEGKFPKGSYVVRMDQPARNVAKTMLEVQHYPEKAQRPYDDVAWTFGYLYDVKTVEIADKSVLSAKMEPVKEKVLPEIEAKAKKGKTLIIENTGGNGLAVLFLARIRDLPASIAEEGFKLGDKDFPGGTVLIDADKLSPEKKEKLFSLAGEVGLRVIGVDDSIKAAKHPLARPRLAIYHSWFYTQDSGWVRYTFDHYGIPYTLINKDRLIKGDLRREFDVILIPHQGEWSSGKDIVMGIDPVFSPVSYEKTEKFKSLGEPDSSSDVTGGMGLVGLLNLKRFTEEGGLVLALGSASRIFVDYGLIRYIQVVRNSGVIVPGSIIRAEITKKESPILYGYGENFPVFLRASFLFQMPKAEREYIVASFAKKDILLSGIVKGEKELSGKAAILDVPLGKGRVVMFSFNPMHRFLNKANFPLVFNALMNYDALLK